MDQRRAWISLDEIVTAGLSWKCRGPRFAPEAPKTHQRPNTTKVLMLTNDKAVYPWLFKKYQIFTPMQAS